MKKHEKEVQQAHLDNEKEVLKKLEKNYEEALAEINDKIAILLGRQDADQQYVIYQVEYQKSLKKQVEAILETLHSNEFETVSEYLAKSYEDGFVGTMYSLQNQGIPLVFPIDQEQVVNAIQHETKLSENLYTALGHDTKDLSKKIASEISRGLSGGQMYSEIARNIAGWARIPKNNAMRIARTEAHRIQCKASMDACYKAKDKGADIVKQWDASLDGKTRPHHRELDGQIRELDEPFEIAGKEAMQPGDFGDPAEDCNCRCSILQRARWALGNDYTKWSPDAPIEISDDGTTQFTIIEAKNYEDFLKKYNQAVEQMETAKVFDFVPAKSIQEAEEFVSQFVDNNVWAGTGISYKGISTESANAVNETLNRLFGTYNMEKLGGVYVAKGNTKLGKVIENATAAYSPVRQSLLLNNSAMKKLESVVEAKQEELRLIALYKENPANVVIKTKRAEDVIKASLVSGRATVPDNVSEVITHEMGHAIESVVRKDANYETIRSNMGRYAERISGYATINEGEYIAESFASYNKGENLIDPELKKVFERLKK